MKKGTLGTLIGVVAAVIIIIFLFRVSYGNFIAPILFNPKNTQSYDNMALLAAKIQEVVNTPAMAAYDEIMIGIEPGHAILTFGETGRTSCENKIIDRPGREYCEQGQGCMCLYKFSKDKFLQDGTDNKELIQSCIPIYLENHYITQTASTMLTEYKQIPRSYVGSPNGLHIYGFQTCVEDASSPNAYLMSIAGVEHKPFNIYVESLKTNSDSKTVYTPLLIYMYKREVVGVNVTTVFIEASNDVNKLGYKKKNMCPDTSDDDCKSQHFDSVHDVVIQSYPVNVAPIPPSTQSPLGFQQVTEQKACKFKVAENRCVYAQIEDCPDGLITTECSCTDTTTGEKIAVDTGFCLNDAYKPNNLPVEYCFTEGIAACKDYANANPSSTTTTPFEDRALACTFNYCELQKDCYWEGDITTQISDCVECPDKCTLDIYATQDVMEMNLCGCSEILCGNTNRCNEYDQLQLTNAEEMCAENPCPRSSDPCVPKYDSAGGYTHCEECPSSCNCDFYGINPPDWLEDLDPCNCGC